jgi:hypothetical protein
MNMHMYLSLSMCKPNMVNLISMSHIQRQNTQTLLMIKCFGFLTLKQKLKGLRVTANTQCKSLKSLANFEPLKLCNIFTLIKKEMVWIVRLFPLQITCVKFFQKIKYHEIEIKLRWYMNEYAHVPFIVNV